MKTLTMNVHTPIKDLSQHATLYLCPKNNVQVVVYTGDEDCESCLRPLDGEPVYTQCKQCGGAFRDVPGAEYSDGLCSVECLKAENSELEVIEDNGLSEDE